MQVSVISPDRRLYEGPAVSVSLPGSVGKFSVLKNHAPIVSVLTRGKIEIQESETADKRTFAIVSGFVEVHDNLVNICVEEDKNAQQE
ncbi:MAG: ATP synthase F1 subunit epsilon [Paludibacteraceae bacterium]|nr:ATP synthase F1 subunit epsilon [Paludibacteraceae bacterium]